MFDLEKLKQASETDLQIANYIATHEEAVAFMRVRELAEKTHVSPATIIRFTQKMGFESFPELRLALKQSLANQESTYRNETHAFFLGDTHFPSKKKKKMSSVVHSLAQASFIHCLGSGSSSTMAQYAQQRFASLGYRSFATVSSFIPYLSTKREKEETTENEVCLLFSVSGETPEIVNIAKMLKETAIFTVAITNKEVNTLASLTDFSLSYDTPTNRRFYSVDMTSQLPVVYIIEELTRKLYEITHTLSEED